MTQPDTADLERSVASADHGRESATSATAHAFVTNTIAVAVGLAISVVVARLLGPAEKGTYDLAIASGGLLALVLGFALPTGITFAVSRGVAEPRRTAVFVVVAAAFQFLFALLLLSWAGSTALGAGFLTADASTAMQLLIAAVAASAAASASMKAIVMGRQLIARASWIDLAGRLLLFALVVGAAIGMSGDDPSAQVIVGCAAAASMATALFLAVAAARGSRRAPSRSAQGLRAVAQGARVALPSYAASVLQFLNYRLDLFLVAFFWSSAEVGLYALAVTIAQLIWLVSNAIGAAMFPRVAAADTNDAAELLRTERFSRFSLASAILLALPLALIASPLVSVVYGSDFQSAAQPIYLLLPGIVAFAPVNVLASHVAGIGRPEFNLLVSAVSLVVAVSLDLMLIPEWGMVGAAAATTISYVVAAIVMVTVCGRLMKSAPRDLLVVTSGDLGLVLERLGRLRGRVTS